MVNTVYNGRMINSYGLFFISRSIPLSRGGSQIPHNNQELFHPLKAFFQILVHTPIERTKTHLEAKTMVFYSIDTQYPCVGSGVFHCLCGPAVPPPPPRQRGGGGRRAHLILDKTSKISPHFVLNKTNMTNKAIC